MPIYGSMRLQLEKAAHTILEKAYMVCGSTAFYRSPEGFYDKMC